MCIYIYVLQFCALRNWWLNKLVMFSNLVEHVLPFETTNGQQQQQQQQQQNHHKPHLQHNIQGKCCSQKTQNSPRFMTQKIPPRLAQEPRDDLYRCQTTRNAQSNEHLDFLRSQRKKQKYLEKRMEDDAPPPPKKKKTIEIIEKQIWEMLMKQHVHPFSSKSYDKKPFILGWRGRYKQMDQNGLQRSHQVRFLGRFC